MGLGINTSISLLLPAFSSLIGQTQQEGQGDLDDTIRKGEPLELEAGHRMMEGGSGGVRTSTADTISIIDRVRWGKQSRGIG